MKTSVSVGITSIVGWGAAVIGFLPSLVNDLESSHAALIVAGPQKWGAIAGMVSLAITQFGRYWQAHAQIKASSGILPGPPEGQGQAHPVQTPPKARR
jgi:hypothetical protein